MIDHEARAKVRQVVDDYLSDRIGSFAFDDRLHEIATATEDGTVKRAAWLLWYTYSDVSHHLVNLNQDGWNTVQRLLLVLDSRAELHETKTWIWHPSQLLAAATLVAVTILAGLIFPLLIGGVVSMTLASVRQRIVASFRKNDPLHARPFPSLAAIKQALARAPTFHKKRHRPEINRRRAESWFNSMSFPVFIEWPLSRLGWCLVSPVILLFQCLPMRVSELHVLAPPSVLANAG